MVQQAASSNFSQSNSSFEQSKLYHGIQTINSFHRVKQCPAAVFKLCLPNVLWLPAELQCPAELCPAEFRPAELGPAELSAAELGPAELRPVTWKPAGPTVSEFCEHWCFCLFCLVSPFLYRNPH